MNSGTGTMRRWQRLAAATVALAAAWAEFKLALDDYRAAG